MSLMTMKNKANTENKPTVSLKRPPSHLDVICRLLSKTPEIDAIFLLTDDVNVLHVFSVVKEFQPKIYDKLLKKERAIEESFPEIAWEFHVRAHQGRDPAHAVPFEAYLVFAR